MAARCRPFAARLRWALGMLWLALAGPGLGLVCGAALAQAEPPGLTPASVFFQYPRFGGAKFSPDGSRVAVLVAAKDKQLQLAVVDLKTMKVNAVLGTGHSGVERFEWINDRRLLVWAPLLGAVNHDGTGGELLQSYMQTGAHRQRGRLDPDTWLVHINGSRKGDDIYVVTPRQNNKRLGLAFFELRRMNTVTRYIEVLDSPVHARQWFFEPDDTLRAVVTGEDERGSLDVLQPDGRWQTQYTFNARDPIVAEPEPAFLAPDGTMYALAPTQGDKSGLYTYDLKQGRLSAQPLLASGDYDLAPSFIANDERVLGLRYEVDAEVTLWLDPQLKAHQATIDALLPATINRVSVAQRPTLPYLLVKSFSDTQPELTYLFNTETRKLLMLGAAFPEIQPQAMGLMELVRVQARDGLQIPTWLTLPRGSEKLARKNLPLVVMVHGGPHVRGNTWGWDASAQFLASRGYAVIQPEFRGSTGFGAKHYAAGWKQWGLGMQTDLADATRWAIAQGIADPRRIAIMGGSYGGYAAMMGLVTDPDLYRCAINYAGVVDIGMMFSVGWSDITDQTKVHHYPTLIGDPDTAAERFTATSPLQQAARITQPVLLAYGERDQRVPLVHGQRMRDALKPHNPNVEWVVYEEEGHGWDKAPTRLDFWGRVERFLAKNLTVTP